MGLRTVCWLLLTLVIALSLSSCSGNSVISPTPEPIAKVTARMMVPQSSSVDPTEALELLAASEPEPGMDAALWEQLTAALTNVLEARRDDKLTSIRPTGPENAIVDLAVVDDGSGGQQIEWSYVNVGDYDQNGEVNISDLAPMGQHFGKTDAQPGWELARLADGDTNGEVNISDITPIGNHFGVSCGGYNIYGRNGGSGSYTLVDTLNLDAGIPSPGLSFVWPVAGAAYDNYMVAAFDFTGDDRPSAPLPNQNAVVVTDMGLSITERTDTTVTMSGDASGIEVGQVLVSGEGEGFMGIVDSIDTSGPDAVVTYTQASLEDLFDFVEIDYADAFTFDDIQDIEFFEEGISIEKAASASGASANNHETSGFGDMVFKFKEHEFGKNAGSAFFGITLQGEIKFKIDFTAKVKIGDTWAELGKLKSCDFGYEIETTGAVEFKAVVKKKWEGEPKLLVSVSGPPITVVPFPIPVIFVPEVNIYANLTGEVEAAISFTPSVIFEGSAGLKYTAAGGWAPYSHKVVDGEMGWEKMEAYAQVQLDLELFSPTPTLKFMGVAGPYAKFNAPYFRGQVKAIASPAGNKIVATGFIGAKAYVGAAVIILGRNLGEYQYSKDPIFNVLIEIAQYTWPLDGELPLVEPTVITVDWQRESDEAYAGVPGAGNANKQWLMKAELLIRVLDENNQYVETFNPWLRTDEEDLWQPPFVMRSTLDWEGDADNHSVSGKTVYDIDQFFDNAYYRIEIETMAGDYPLIINSITVTGGLTGEKTYGPEYAFYGGKAVFMTYSSQARELFFADPLNGKNTYPIYASGSRLDADGWFPHRE